MIEDRSVVVRLNPETMHTEYLRAVAGIWEWTGICDERYVFPSHSEASAAARAKPSVDAHGREHASWALVLPGAGDLARETPPARMERARQGRRPSPPTLEPEPVDAGRWSPPPSEVYRRLEERGLA